MHNYGHMTTIFLCVLSVLAVSLVSFAGVFIVPWEDCFAIYFIFISVAVGFAGGHYY